MMDLIALIQPGTGCQLTNAIDINDRGEILAKAAPVGFTPDDDTDLGPGCSFPALNGYSASGR